ATAATHNATVTSNAGRCNGTHHGGPPPADGTVTTARLGPATDTITMITMAVPIPAPATQPASRVLARAGLSAGVTTDSLMRHAPAARVRPDGRSS
ncbi:MAG TPA: hypothetical protein VMV17_19735, partial [Streptosporangiaceae bacterium]|nr:hypothetical protein [Streptosporangiaceae bacterium]